MLINDITAVSMGSNIKNILKMHKYPMKTSKFTGVYEANA